MKISVVKAALAVAATAVVAIAAFIFFQRISILQYTAETVIRSVLPECVSIGSVRLDAGASRITVRDFAIVNPPGFSSGKLITIGEVSCRYRMRGRNILDGMELFDPEFRNPVLYIERRSDGRLNLNEMPAVLANAQASRASGAKRISGLSAARAEASDRGRTAGRAAAAAAMALGRNTADIIKLPAEYAISGGRLVFSDRAAAGGPHDIVFDGVNGRISLVLNDAYTKVLRVGSTGEGFLNGHKDETVAWTVELDPATPRLTMSNRFEVSGARIKTFEPYYDRYSPVIFRTGTFSGNLVFDFDNGNIGSTNEVRLADITFSVKPGAENADFWGSTVPDLVRYFTSSTGEIIFDFKIKGDMAKPNFYLGPISKKALMSMAIDKISAAIAAAAEQGSGSRPQDERARAVADAVKLLMKKVK
jgi:hypothetical protein